MYVSAEEVEFYLIFFFFFLFFWGGEVTTCTPLGPPYMCTPLRIAVFDFQVECLMPDPILMLLYYVVPHASFYFLMEDCKICPWNALRLICNKDVIFLHTWTHISDAK